MGMSQLTECVKTQEWWGQQKAGSLRGQSRWAVPIVQDGPQNLFYCNPGGRHRKGGHRFWSSWVWWKEVLLQQLLTSLRQKVRPTEWAGRVEAGVQGVRSKASISHGAEREERKEGPAQHPLGKEMATHSSILAWEIPWAEESGGVL